jgi:PAS domain S-box-containing protein
LTTTEPAARRLALPEGSVQDKTAVLEITLDHMDQGLMMFDEHGTVQVCNRRAIELLDLPAELMTAKPTFAAVREYQLRSGEFDNETEAFRSWVRTSGFEGKHQVYERIRPNGTVLEIRTVPLPDGGAVRTYTDITARRAAERAGAQSEQRYRLLAENASDLVILRDRAGERIYVSPSCKTMLGYEPDEFATIPNRELIHPDDYPNVEEKLGRLSGVQPRTVTVHRVRHRDGHYIWVEAVAKLAKSEGADEHVLVTARDVTERQMQAAELQAEKNRAEEASKAKGDFLAVMSHEIRTPITGMLGMVDLLAAENLDARKRSYVEAITSSGRHLLAIISNVLDFSRIEAGKIELERVDFSLASLLDDLHLLMAPEATERGLDLSFEIQPSLPQTVRGDPTRIRQVLINLVSNALKFTQRGSVGVTLSSAPSHGHETWLRFNVADTGIGISEPTREKMFLAFVQADSTMTRRYAGTGLGLAISKQLVEAMNGAIGVDSVPGQGSSFWFDVPLEPGDPKVAAARAGFDRGSVHPLRVLLAEDVELNRDVICAMLRRHGHEVAVAVNGAEALEQVERCRFDVVLMDVHMPVMDGIQATRRIRNLPGEAGKVRVVGLTADVLATEQERCLSAGMDACLTKPIDWDQLLHALAPAAGETQSRDTAVADTLLNLKTIRKFKAQLPSEEFQAFLNRALDDAEQVIRRMQTLLDRPVELASEAHALKGSSGLLGLNAIRALAAEIETTVRNGGEASDLIDRLPPALMTTRAEACSLFREFEQ